MPRREDLGFWMVHFCQCKLRPQTTGEEMEETSPAGVSNWAEL